MLIAEFTYNNAGNINTGYIQFEFDYRYHLRVLFKEETNSSSKSHFVNKLAEELRKLIEIYC